MKILKENRMNKKRHIPSFQSCGLFVNKNRNIEKRKKHGKFYVAYVKGCS
jgi:predicted transcriptional regulator